jgi:ATP-binding cassette, subfamily B, bacterial PglK
LINLSVWKKAWALLDMRERRMAWIVLAISVSSAMAMAVSVGSVMPFLAVLSDPSRIQTTPALAWAYEALGYMSVFSFLVALGLGSFLLIVISSLAQIVKTWALARFSMMFVHSTSYRLLAVYLAQPYDFFLNRHSGEMGPLVLSETEQVVQQFLRPASEFIAACLTTFTIVGLLLWVNPITAIVAFAVLGGSYALIYLFVQRQLKRLGQIRVRTNLERFRMASESLTGIKDIKLLGCEGSYLNRFAEPSMLMAETRARTEVISSVPQVGLQAIALGGALLLCILLIDPSGLASGQALGGILPTLGVFAFAGQRLLPELSKLYRSLAQIQAGTAAVDAIHEDLIGHRGANGIPEETPSGLGIKQSLLLQNVTYRYPNAEHAGVQELTLSISAGEKIGIVGSTGAGKTTLADIILGLLTPDSGILSVDGSEINGENVRSWMQSVGYVPQDIFLTDASVSENIALGVKPEEVDHERVRSAASIARIDDFIEADLPEGYKTHVGERGVRLSGGQRQRIGIARALYHQADLIVFDEATSALDNLTEAEVMEAINAIPGEKTVIMIAHRLSTVKRCDRIIVLDQGRVVGCDSWCELMSGNAAFQRIASIAEAGERNVVQPG